MLGIHTDLINNGPFDQNEGLVGFYNDEEQLVSGALMPIFFDAELANLQGLQLLTPIGVTSNINFIEGNVITDRDATDIYLHFDDEAFFSGQGDPNKVDGYAAVSGQQNFVFPVGDAVMFRELVLNSSAVNSLAKCAYFFESPNAPISIPDNFSTTALHRDLEAVSESEFWVLSTDVPSEITLHWNERSNLAALTSDINEITIVGYSKSAAEWVDLGAAGFGGNMTNGFVTSENFTPDMYAAVTFGARGIPQELLTLDNYFLSPDGDGINDSLVIEGMELSPNNSISIYNRAGLKVFAMDNYTNEFIGYSNLNNLVINRNEGLPEGLYFYVVSLDDLGQQYQGFLFLDK
jgi:gliding motility-associated-like protein